METLSMIFILVCWDCRLLIKNDCTCTARLWSAQHYSEYEAAYPDPLSYVFEQTRLTTERHQLQLDIDLFNSSICGINNIILFGWFHCISCRIWTSHCFRSFVFGRSFLFDGSVYITIKYEITLLYRRFTWPCRKLATYFWTYKLLWGYFSISWELINNSIYHRRDTPARLRYSVFS